MQGMVVVASYEHNCMTKAGMLTVSKGAGSYSYHTYCIILLLGD